MFDPPSSEPEKRHLRTDKFVESKPYASPHTVPSGSEVPAKPRGEHGAALVQTVERLKHDYAELLQNWQGREEIRARGIIVEF